MFFPFPLAFFFSPTCPLTLPPSTYYHSYPLTICDILKPFPSDFSTAYCTLLLLILISSHLISPHLTPPLLYFTHFTFLFNFLYHPGIGKNSREEEPVLKPALQLWLENGFKPSLTATEVQDNPGRYVRAKKLCLLLLLILIFFFSSSSSLFTVHDTNIQTTQTEDDKYSPTYRDT